MLEETTADAKAEPTVEDRLAAAESTITTLKGEVAQLKSESSRTRWVVAVLAAAGLTAAGLYVIELRASVPQSTNHDATVAELLRPGVHCYDTPAEQAVARQRALAAIERQQWEYTWASDHPPAGGYPIGAPGPVPVKAPVVRDDRPVGASWDAALCFEVD